jgi:hypothetical protein
MIFIYSGTYSESLVIEKSLVITGESQDLTIIDGGGADNVIQVLNSESLSISYLTLINASTGVNIQQSGLANIKNISVLLSYNAGKTQSQ